MEYDYLNKFYFVNPDISNERLKDIDWSLLDDNNDCITQLWGFIAPEETKSEFGPIIRRISKLKHKRNVPPVDIAQLKQDAEQSNDETIRTQMKMLSEWLNSFFNLKDEYNLLIKDRDELKRQLDFANAKLSLWGNDHKKLAETCFQFNEKISYYEGEYYINKGTISDLMSNKIDLELKIKELKNKLEKKEESLVAKEQQLAAQTRDKMVEVLQKQLDDANDKISSLQSSINDKNTKASNEQTQNNIKLFISGIRDRCKRKDQNGKTSYLDDLMGSTLDFPVLNDAIKQLYKEMFSGNDSKETAVTQNFNFNNPKLDVKALNGNINIEKQLNIEGVEQEDIEELDNDEGLDKIENNNIDQIE